MYFRIVLNYSLNLQVILVIFFLTILLSKSSLVIKKPLIIDYCYLCKYNFFLIENLEVSNDNIINTEEGFKQEMERKEIEEIIQFKITRLKIRFNDILQRIENKAPYPFSDHILPENLAALIKDFDYKGVKFEQERYVYLHDDTFPTKTLRHAFIYARIALINKKYLNKLNT